MEPDGEETQPYDCCIIPALWTRYTTRLGWQSFCRRLLAAAETRMDGNGEELAMVEACILVFWNGIPTNFTFVSNNDHGHHFFSSFPSKRWPRGNSIYYIRRYILWFTAVHHFLQLFWTDNFHLGIMTFIFQTGPDLESGGWGKGFIALR